MQKIYKKILFLVFIFSTLTAFANESFEGKKVAKINIDLETLLKGGTFDNEAILARLRTKVGDPFSQNTFDHDLKALSEDYDRVEPTLKLEAGELYITLKLWQKPTISSIKWIGNKKIKSKKLQSELGIKPYTTFNRKEFIKSFNKVKEYYIKKGFFESELHYRIIPEPESNEISIEIMVTEGHSGHISKFVFNGFTKAEQSEILAKINSKKHNFFLSWVTGAGTYHEEILEHDKLIIVNILQNEGYANAKVDIHVEDTESGKIQIEITAHKGELFHFGYITYVGNTLISTEDLEKHTYIKKGSIYSPEKLRDTVENLKHLYGKDGYIETNIAYNLELNPAANEYNVHFHVEEGEQFKIGLIQVLGNVTTNKNVILRESLLVPGEVFDSRKLKATQERLQSVGYFKSVNVYAVKTPEDESLGENYRDVIIEVEETTTGNVSLFFGLSSTDSIFGGLDLAENNFNIKGLGRIWKDGLKAVRGGGEYAHLRVSVGKKQSSYGVSWLTPYFRDSMWRVGFDLNYSNSGLQTDDYHVKTLGGSIFASLPLNSLWTYGVKYRLSNSIIHVSGNASAQEQDQERNSGIVTGIGTSLQFNSTDNAFKPHRGFRSIMEAEIAGTRRHNSYKRSFPFLKFNYLNTYYYPLWAKGTIKTRADVRFIKLLGMGEADLLPINERYFLGGDTSVRGYKPFILGPKYPKKNDPTQASDDPKGGVTSTLVSVEYLQNVFRMIDAFVFFDAGAISEHQFDVGKLKMSYGGGLRLELANRVPMILGLGFPINPTRKDDEQKFFFSMGGQF